MCLTAILLRIFFDLNFISFSWLLCRFSFNLEFFLIIKCKDARIACDVLKIMCFKDFFFQKSFRVSKVSVGRVFYDFLLEWSVQWVFSEQKYHFRLKTEYSYFMTVLVLFQFVELILWIKKSDHYLRSQKYDQNHKCLLQRMCIVVFQQILMCFSFKIHRIFKLNETFSIETQR